MKSTSEILDEIAKKYGNEDWLSMLRYYDDVPYLFTTEDGVDIYKGEQEYIDSLKPKFKTNQWCICDNSFDEFDNKYLFRYLETDMSNIRGDEVYRIWRNKLTELGDNILVCSKNSCRVATDKEIESFLSEVAIHKGFKEGVKYRNALSGDITKFDKDGKFFYNSLDGLGCKYSGWIYYQGKWAEIIDAVPEYVECIKIPEKWWNWNEMYVGRVFKTCEDAVPGDRYRLLLESGGGQTIDKETEQYFKPSLKEAYELQQFKNNSKQVTITVDGQVTSVSSYGSEVKINYITK